MGVGFMGSVTLAQAQFRVRVRVRVRVRDCVWIVIESAVALAPLTPQISFNLANTRFTKLC
jgi:hypothetical protein